MSGMCSRDGARWLFSQLRGTSSAVISQTKVWEVIPSPSHTSVYTCMYAWVSVYMHVSMYECVYVSCFLLPLQCNTRWWVKGVECHYSSVQFEKNSLGSDTASVGLGYYPEMLQMGRISQPMLPMLLKLRIPMNSKMIKVLEEFPT